MVCQFPVPSIPLLCSKDIFCCDSAKLKLMLGSRIFTRFLNVPLLRLRTLTLRCPTVHGARQRRLYRALAAFDCGWRYCCGGCGPAARVCLKLWRFDLVWIFYFSTALLHVIPLRNSYIKTLFLSRTAALDLFFWFEAHIFWRVKYVNIMLLLTARRIRASQTLW